VRLTSIAVVLVLLIVAAAGVVVVRELTRPERAEPIAPIMLDPSGRPGDGDREGGFEPPGGGG
jgi:hypothetical protein